MKAEVITLSDSADWSVSTPIILPFSVSAAAAFTDWSIEPPQANTTSVPFVYQPEIWVCNSVEAENEPPYKNEIVASTVVSNSAAAACIPWT